jgi:hypothetical protein
VPEDPLVAAMLVDYFPKPLQQRFSEPMQRHPLRREILATHLTNALVNRVGCAFVHRLMEETDAKPGDIVRACIMARDVFDLDAVWRDIDALDNRVADDVQARMFVDVARLLERAAVVPAAPAVGRGGRRQRGRADRALPRRGAAHRAAIAVAAAGERPRRAVGTATRAGRRGRRRHARRARRERRHLGRAARHRRSGGHLRAQSRTGRGRTSRSARC